MKKYLQFLIIILFLTSCGPNIIDTNISFELNEPIMLVNHYAIQSVEAWNNRSKTSAVGNHYPGFIRDINLFNQLDVNDVNDKRLKLQNSKMV